MKSFVTFITAILAATFANAQQPLQCNDNESLLRISYTITQDEWNELETLATLKRLAIRPSSYSTNTSDNVVDDVSDIVEYYTYEETLTPYEKCIPNNNVCLEVSISEIPSSNFEITFDGDVIQPTNKDTPFVTDYGDRITSTQVGTSCYPTCEDDESLFEYQYWSTVGFEDYRLEDINTTTIGVDDDNVLLRCDSYKLPCQENALSDALYTNLICLKKNGCYQFLVGDNFHRIPDHEEFYSSNYILNWNGKALEKSDSMQFDSIRFGDGCSAVEAPEFVDDCSMVEFFMHRVESSWQPCEDEPDLNWELKWQPNDVVIAEGIIPSCSNTSLYHERMCVKKDTCASFSISSPTLREFVAPPYKVTMDGIIYKFKELDIDDTSSSFGGLVHTTNMGSCTVDDICGDDDLLEVKVTTPSEYIHNDDTSLDAIPEMFSWTLASPAQDTNKDDGMSSNNEKHPLASSYHFSLPTAELNSTYCTIECVKNDDCDLAFKFNSEFDVELEVKRNGDEIYIDSNLFDKDCISSDVVGSEGGGSSGGSSTGGSTSNEGGSMDEGAGSSGESNQGISSSSGGNGLSRHGVYVSIMFMWIVLWLY